MQLDAIELLDEADDPHQIFDVVTGSERIYAMGNFVIYGVTKDDPSSQWFNGDCLPDVSGFCTNIHLAYAAERLVVVRQNFIVSPPQLGYELVVLHASTGLKDWSLNLGIGTPEVAMEGNDLLILTNDAAAGEFSRWSLSKIKEFGEPAEVDSSGPHQDGAAIVNAGRFIYARGDRIRAYNTDDGQPAWVYTPTVKADTYGYDLVATDEAVFISQAERVIKLDIVDGSFEWEKDIEPATCEQEMLPNGAATNGAVVAVTAVCNRELVVLDAASGTVKWRKELGLIGSPSAIAMGGDVLYAAALITTTQQFTPTLFSIYSFDPDTGTELQRLDLDPNDGSSVLPISDGLLLTASNTGSGFLKRFERTPVDLAAGLSTNALPVCGTAVGGTVSFNFQVTNNGPGSTDATRADLTLPDGARTFETSAGSCFDVASPYCDLGPLAPQGSVQITATVVLSAAGSYAPGISLSGNVRDLDASNDSAGATLTVDPAPPAGIDIWPAEIEITQGVQDLFNSVPLVQGKSTFVRLYSLTNGGMVNNVSATLRGERNLSGEDLGTLNPINGPACLSVDDAIDRDRLDDSFVFQLPDDWVQAGVRFTAEINTGGAIPEADTTNNTLEIFRPFIPLPRVCLKTYPVRTTGKEDGSDDEVDDLSPSAWAIADDDGNILSRALTMLPVREIKVYPSSHLIEEWEPFAEGGWGPYEMEKEDDNRGDVLDTLWWLNLFTDDPDACDADDSRTHYVGMVHEGTTNSVGSAGLGIRDGDELMLFLNTGANGPWRFDDPHGGLTLAHEIGHNYDRGHVDCGDPEKPDPDYPYDPCNFASTSSEFGDYGFEFRDPTAPVVITPTMAGDLMSYADDVWTSDYTWDAIQGVLCKASDCLSPNLALSLVGALEGPPPITGDVLVVRGWISPTVAIQDLYRLPVGQVPKADEMWAAQIASKPLTATYALNLISGTTLLHSEPFTPTHADDQSTELSGFGLIIPWITGTTGIELAESGSAVITLTVSPSPPMVTAVTPNGGETVTDTLHVSWAAVDPDGDDLRYSVQYSPDNGTTWQALATGIETTTVTIDSSLLPGTAEQGLVKVVATDGLNSASRQSDAGFTIPNRPPRAIIYLPADGGEYPSGATLTLRGAVYDPEEGYLPGGVLSWTLSGTGLLGAGEEILLSGLEDDEYTLTLSAADSHSQLDQNSITFTIGGGNDVYLPTILKE